MRNVRNLGHFDHFWSYLGAKKSGTFWDFLIWSLVYFVDFNLATLISSLMPVAYHTVFFFLTVYRFEVSYSYLFDLPWITINYLEETKNIDI